MEQAEFIRWLLDVTGLSRAELAEYLGISPSLVSRIAKGERNLRLSLLQQVAERFRIPLEKVYEKAGILSTEKINWEAKAKELEDLLLKLKNPHHALEYSLEGRLPPKTIEKLWRVIELELEFSDSV